MNWTFELMSHNCTCHAEMVLTLIANDMAENPPTYSTIGLISFKLRALMCRVREHKLGSNILETWTFHFFYWNYVFQNWLHHFENQFSFIKVTQVMGSLKLLVWPSEVRREKLTNQKSKHGALKRKIFKKTEWETELLSNSFTGKGGDSLRYSREYFIMTCPWPWPCTVNTRNTPHYDL